MLENLLNTRLKKKLLSIFFDLPKRSFSFDELVKLSHATARYVNHTLREFARDQIVNIATRNRRRYYMVNPHFSLYDELLDLLRGEREAKTEDEVARLVRSLPNLRLAILSGIFTLQPHSSVDLFLVGARVSRSKLQRIVAEIEHWVGEEINYAVMEPEEFQYRRMMNDRFVRDILDYPYLTVINNFKSLK